MGIRKEMTDQDDSNSITVQILCIGTDRSQQTVQTKIRLLLKKQSDQGLRCLPFHQHLLDALMQCYINFLFLGQLWQLFEVSQILEFLRYLKSIIHGQPIKGYWCTPSFFSFSTTRGGRVVRWCWVNFQCRGVLQFGLQ